MSETPIDEPTSPGPEKSTEYEDVMGDVLKDLVRRGELRSAATPKPARTRMHPAIPPVLAFVSIWLWVFPPAVLRPDVPTIPPANQEAGLRMEMWDQRVHILRYRSEHGRLPGSLDEVGEGSTAVEYTRLTDDVFRLSGTAGDVPVSYTSTEPVEDLLGDAVSIVGGVSSTPRGADVP